MSTVHILIGIPGSGKTTYAKNVLIKKYPEAVLISSDEVRNMNPTFSEDKIWPEIYRLCREAIKANKDLIFDATNITPTVRQRFDDKMAEEHLIYDKIAYHFKTLTNVCYERVLKRNEDPNERFLPPEVVPNYGEKIISPTIDEGFKEIIVIE